MHRRFLAALLLTLSLVPRPLASEAGRPLTLEAIPLPVDDGNREVGSLRLVAAFELRSPDPAFGGFSGVALRQDGAKLTAVSDRGHWITATLVHDGSGTLRAVEGERLGALLRPDGEPVRSERERDAEELVQLGGGAWLVSFEGDHRIWRYPSATAPSGRPVAVPTPGELTQAGGNVGLEAMARLADGRMLILTEDFRRDDRAFRGWLGKASGDRWEPFAVHATEDFKPTSATTAPNGDLVLLERAYDPRTGVRARLSTVPVAALAAGAAVHDQELGRLGLAQHVDNFEAVAVHAWSDGRRAVYVLSDDNFNEHQRTVLLQLAW